MRQRNRNRNPSPELGRRWWPWLLALALTACGEGEGGSGIGYALHGGGELALESLRGRWVFINYWAEWCAPCREEIPELNAFAAAHPDRVRMLSVNFDGVIGEPLSGQLAALGITFPTLLADPRTALGVPPAQGLPETLVIDPEGRLHRVLQGPQTRATLAAAMDAAPR
ncbi:MAG TPA: TlpA disulfide reductase family protein [Porticoccaceae bacterium]|nr:TlpA disulfide reductase family protein [Porticoccaceae bacterium]